MSEINYTCDEMTDYQFKYIMDLKDKVAELTRELESSRSMKSCELHPADGMTDFQYKNLIEMIYQILKANFEAGKTPEELLAIIAALKKAPESEKPA